LRVSCGSRCCQPALCSDRHSRRRFEGHVRRRSSALDAGNLEFVTRYFEPRNAVASDSAIVSQTIERIGAGGMGEVYKLRDLKLDRIVAGKVVRRKSLAAAVGSFLNEARALALFSDPRIVQVYEFRPDATAPVIIMEYVDGFELGGFLPSLEVRQLETRICVSCGRGT
jgi:serine/threonine protein kinase